MATQGKNTPGTRPPGQPQERIPLVVMPDESQDWLRRGREARLRQRFVQKFGREPTPEEIEDRMNPPLERFLDSSADQDTQTTDEGEAT